jgi:hypothetical protein
MTRATTVGAVLLAVAVAVAGVPAAAIPTSPGVDGGETPATQAAANNSSVNVTVGQQLSTVISATSDDVQTAYEEATFEAEFENGNESERAAAVAERAAELGERAQAIREAYRNATAAHEAGTLSTSAYAQRLATLNARASNLLESARALRERAGNVSALELRAAGFDPAALDAAVERVQPVTGAGATAVYRRFVGETDGELELETRGGLSIEVERNDGERSREVERPRDNRTGFSVNQSAALATARSALSTPANGSWVLARASVHDHDGYYRFEFRLAGAPASGEAEVRVDGSSGDVFRVEEEIEAGESEEGDRDEANETDERDADELALVVAEGTPAPNATVTVRVLRAGEPASGATVTLDGERVGTTDADGTIAVTLPADGATLRATAGDAEGELEFEFESESRDEVYRSLDVSAELDDGTVTVSVSYDGDPVANATVYADGERVGTTGGDGTVAFAANVTEDLEVTVEKGEFEAELAYTVQDGDLVLSEGASAPDEDEDDESNESESESESEDEHGDSDESEDDDSGNSEGSDDADDSEDSGDSSGSGDADSSGGS